MRSTTRPSSKALYDEEQQPQSNPGTATRHCSHSKTYIWNGLLEKSAGVGWSMAIRYLPLLEKKELTGEGFVRQFSDRIRILPTPVTESYSRMESLRPSQKNEKPSNLQTRSFLQSRP